ncbi:MAG: hypothetical protein E7514_02450 [Ruminococcaceae bacterium]|nr:hypothetical protein [Oscillospiraceae bacterium]
MISLIIGHKGSGKTKRLVDEVNAAMASSNGSVVCVEKETKLTYDVSSRVRLVATDDYAVSGFDAFYGFLSGICAGDYDITDIFVDATFRIGTRDYEQLADFLAKVNELGEKSSTHFTFTISTDLENLPKRIFDFSEKIN